jgi:hypothetical protein
MKILITAVLLLTQFGAIQCNSSNKNPDKKSESPNEYFPLRNNIQWKYTSESPREETEIINVECKSDGNKFKLDKFPFFGISDSKAELRSDKDGSVYVKDEGGKESLLLPPAKKLENGYTWKYNDILSAFVSNSPAQIKTEAGTFDCIYIVYTEGFTFSYEMWFAKDVGIVKWAATRTNPPSIPKYYVLKEFKE